MLGTRKDNAKEADAFDDARREQNELARCLGSGDVAKRDGTHSTNQRSPNTQPADHDTGADTRHGAHRREDRYDQAGDTDAERQVTADQRNRDDGLADLRRSDDTAADEQQDVEAPRSARRS